MTALLILPFAVMFTCSLAYRFLSHSPTWLGVTGITATVISLLLIPVISRRRLWFGHAGVLLFILCVALGTRPDRDVSTAISHEKTDQIQKCYSAIQRASTRLAVGEFTAYCHPTLTKYWESLDPARRESEIVAAMEAIAHADPPILTYGFDLAVVGTERAEPIACWIVGRKGSAEIWFFEESEDRYLLRGSPYVFPPISPEFLSFDTAVPGAGNREGKEANQHLRPTAASGRDSS